MTRRRITPALAALLCAVAAGCSAGGGSKSGSELFTRRCGGCRTLSVAKTTGTRGVNFDYRKVTEKDALFAIRNGGFSGGKMPANIVVGDDAKTVAKFVARASGSKASGDLDSPHVRRLKAGAAGAQAGPLAPPTSGGDTTFLRAAFDSAQSLWREKFAAEGLRYRPALLTFFHSRVATACGPQTARTGPFYCPADHGVYLNTQFFEALARTFGLKSPFAPGYVVAHEVAHHVQQLLRLHARVAAANARDPGGKNNRSVRVELQADCYAGIWLHFVARTGELSEGDVGDILRAAASVGDDFLRNRAGAELAPETWTHGSSAQRVHWATVGKDTGLPARCDTFAPG